MANGNGTLIRGTTYWFRRRVPRNLAIAFGETEIARSLRTSCPRIAARRSREAWITCERAFQQMSRKSLAAEQAHVVIRRLKDEPLWDSPTAAEIVERITQGEDDGLTAVFAEADGIMALPPAEQDRVIQHLTNLTDRLALEVAKGQARANEVRAELAEFRGVVAELEATQAVGRVLKLADRAIGTARRATDRLKAENAKVPLDKPLVEAQPVAVTPDIRLTSTVRFTQEEDAFFIDKRYDDHTEKQNRKTFELWLEMIGDRPVSHYTLADAGTFKATLLRLPSSHGKGRKMVSAEAIRQADAKERAGEKITRLSAKTAKRHFSTLSQYWEFLAQRGDVEKNIFLGFFKNYSRKGNSERNKRDEWSTSDLELLVGATWDRTNISDLTYQWVTLISVFSGMWLEEVCRLRPVDIEVFDGTPTMLVQEQPDWSPKTEAGERPVPIHDALIQAGFLDLVDRRRAEGVRRLFPGLMPTGPGGKLSAQFSREFSRFKSGLGVGKKTTFHSFRHNIETCLQNEDAEIRDSWIDAVMGHSGGSEKSVGIKVYLKQIGAENLARTVNRISYPVDLTRLLRRN